MKNQQNKFLSVQHLRNPVTTAYDRFVRRPFIAIAALCAVGPVAAKVNIVDTSQQVNIASTADPAANANANLYSITRAINGQNQDIGATIATNHTLNAAAIKAGTEFNAKFDLTVNGHKLGIMDNALNAIQNTANGGKLGAMTLTTLDNTVGVADTSQKALKISANGALVQDDHAGG